MQPQSMIDEDEFDRDARDNVERRVVNVSPYVARIEIATTPGTRPRRHRLEPGQSMYLQQGYCTPFLSVTRQPVAAWIETHTEREAWPGQRTFDSNSEKYVWKVPPGPRLPSVVEEGRAEEIKARWDQAMADKESAATAPLRLTLQRQDGVPVDVEATIAPQPVPMRRAPPVDEEDQTVALDEPPPDDDTPPEPEIPVVTAPVAPADSTRPGRRGR